MTNEQRVNFKVQPAPTSSHLPELFINPECNSQGSLQIIVNEEEA